MGKSSRDWAEIYSIYGIDDWQTLAYLLLHAAVFSFLSIVFLLYFSPISSYLHSFSFFSSAGAARFLAGFVGAFAALTAVCLIFAAGNLFYSAGALRWEMSQRMVGAVPDWSNVRTALDVGCGRGVLLNEVAKRMKKEGSSGRVVGLDLNRSATMSTLRTACIEGVQEYVTCREGDVRKLPFSDNYFDAVVSAVFLHRVGKEHGRTTAAAAAERVRVVGEVVRVLKPGGVAVVWDLQHVPEYVRKLRELRMEDIRVSERVTAFMMSSHIVSFRKPRQLVVGPGEDVTLDWRFHSLDGHEIDFGI
ncbi:hypothetical protein V2J09_008830 [Rumex salicifolius]